MNAQQRLDILKKAYTAAQAGDYQQAEVVLKRIHSQADPEVCLFLGTMLVHAGKLDEAREVFTSLLVMKPQDMEILTGLAHIYRRQGKFQDALRLFNEAAALDSCTYEIYYHIGIIQKQLGNLKPAFMAYAKTIELNPHYIPAYNNLGIVYAASKEYAKAITVLHQGLALDRNNPLLHFNYGVALMAHKQFEAAALEYETALRYKADWDEALNNWGVVLFKQQREQALDIFTKLLERNPTNYRALNNKGVVLAALGRTQEALTHFQLTLTVVPKHQKASRNLKRIMNQRRNPTHSHDAFQPFEIIGMMPAQDTEHEFFTIKKPKSLEKAKAGTSAASKVKMIPSEQVHNSDHNMEPAGEWGFESIERPLLVKLLKYLHLLTKSLPQQQEEEFFKSKTRLDLEQIIRNLELRT